MADFRSTLSKKVRNTVRPGVLAALGLGAHRWSAMSAPSVTTSATWGIDTSSRYLGLAKTPMASGWLPDTVFQLSFGFVLL